MKIFYHLPGLFEFYDLYKAFLPLFREHREWFYDWCEIGSIYGAPADCIWGGGRVGFGDEPVENVAELMKEHGISARLTFSNSLLREEHLGNARCNELCKMFEGCGNVKGRCCAEDVDKNGAQNGVIVHSDLLLNYLKEKYPNFYFVSSTTKVITDFDLLVAELNRDEFRYVVPDFRLNKELVKTSGPAAAQDDAQTTAQNAAQTVELTTAQKQKVEFLCNECCWFGCQDRKICYENVSRKNLGEDCKDHICKSPGAKKGYRFSDAMKNPGFIGIDDIQNIYAPAGFSQFKIEGRSLGSALILEFLLYYMTKPEYQLNIREEIYLDSTLDLF